MEQLMNLNKEKENFSFLADQTRRNGEQNNEYR